MASSQNILGIIGGSGLYQIDGLSNVAEIDVITPFGPPSAPVIRGEIAGMRLLFLPRHGRKHTILPSEINYRANIFALKTLGANWCLSISAVGSLKEELSPGTIVIPDQIIDRTYLRKNTFFGDGLVAHVSLADPFCPTLRKALMESCRECGKELGFKHHSGGSYVCMEGPAFSTRAESLLYREWGASVIGMTNLPEAKLAREAEIAYATLALVTDYDCWKEEEEAVDVATVLRVLHKNADNAKKLVVEIAKRVSSLEPSELAANALKNAMITKLSDVPRETIERLKPLLTKYL